MQSVVIVAAVLLILVFFAECKRELGFFKVTRYSLCVPKLSNLKHEKKILLLADLHNKEYGENNEKLLKAIINENPDLILIAGDMLVARENTSFVEALNLMQKLSMLCPVYYSLGNHEQRLKENPDVYGEDIYITYKKELLNAGIHLLENENEDILLDKLQVQVSGLELPIETYKKFRKHSVTASDIRRYAGTADNDKFHILLAHNPAFFPAYKEWGADLTVSGHLHGGIIRIPGVGGVITPQAMLFPKYSGEMTIEGNKAIAVSRGLGTHTINLRFCNYAEVVAINLLPYHNK